MNDFIKNFEPLFKDIKSFTYFQHFIHDELSNKYVVVGINATAPSLARKSFTIQMINDRILEGKMPLEVTDSNPETTLFTIKIKK